ncbi:glycerophosphodiester phosphodiesterase family protein [Sutterella sp.]|uniref:glycerophosphodiester phosphodiesterase family protein n=1 Tax=Sutterella sp. TaxID=1981025 RepID=UPI0026DFBBE5|nr:glycerophosphodiester phosphodiesterase family protein [Sutterella sp.]MDO5532039.1 glycerophosphodiester phosphodiesterase family protein [Sutterella sp.]
MTNGISPSGLPWPFPRILAHRAGGVLAPENTLEAFRTGLIHGYRGVETDAMLTRDGVPVLMHDEKFGRTIRDDSRSVPELTADELRKLDAGGWHSPFWYGVHPPLLSDALEWCRRNGMWLNLEIKPAKGHEFETGLTVATAVAEAYSDVISPNGDQQANVSKAAPLLSSYSREALSAAREAAPYLPRALLVDDVPADWRRACETLGCVSLNADWRFLTPDLCRQIKEAGLWLFAYTPNDRDTILKLFRMGVDSVCTDRLDRVPPVL